MASIKLGAIVADIKGKLAGNYFAKRKNTTVLAVCGSKLTKADAGRVSLQKARNQLGFVASQWSAANEVQRTLWQSFASTLTWYTKVGIAYTPSGYQAFTQCNSNLLIIDESINYEPAEPTTPGDVNRCQINTAAGPLFSYSYAGERTEGKMVVISATARQSYGVAYAKGGYKKIAVLGPDELGPISINSAYAAVFGAVPTSGNVFFKMELIDKTSGIAEGSKLTKADAGLV